MGYRSEKFRTYPVTLEHQPGVILVGTAEDWPETLLETIRQRVHIEAPVDVASAMELLRQGHPDLVLLSAARDEPAQVYAELVTASGGTVPIRILHLTSPGEASPQTPEAQVFPREHYFTSPSAEELAQQVWAELELQRLRGEVLNARRELDHHVQQQARFISLLAHDLRNPFHHLRLFPEFVRDNLENVEPDVVRQMADEACSEVERVSSLLEEMLEYAVLQMDRLEVNPECMPVSPSIHSVLEDALPAAQDKGVELVGPSYCHHNAVSDDKLVRTVLRNLVANAIKFTDKGDRVEVTIRDFGPRLRVDVQDTGVGLDMEKVRKIFDLGKKLRQSGTRSEKGHGYGLFLCDQLLARLDSRIFVSGMPGEGALFFFYLPKCQGSGKGHDHD